MSITAVAVSRYGKADAGSITKLGGLAWPTLGYRQRALTPGERTLAIRLLEMYTVSSLSDCDAWRMLLCLLIPMQMLIGECTEPVATTPSKKR